MCSSVVVLKDAVGCFTKVGISGDVITELEMVPSERKSLLSCEHVKGRMWMSE